MPRTYLPYMARACHAHTFLPWHVHATHIFISGPWRRRRAAARLGRRREQRNCRARPPARAYAHVHVCIYDMHVCNTRSSTSCTGPTHNNKQCTPVCVTLSSSVVPLQFQQTLISYSSLFLQCTDVESIFLESAHQYYLDWVLFTEAQEV